MNQATRQYRIALGARLRTAREAMGATQNGLARKLGMRQRDISQLESGIKLFLPTPYLQCLAAHVDLNALLLPEQPGRRTSNDMELAVLTRFVRHAERAFGSEAVRRMLAGSYGEQLSHLSHELDGEAFREALATMQAIWNEERIIQPVGK